MKQYFLGLVGEEIFLAPQQPLTTSSPSFIADEMFADLSSAQAKKKVEQNMTTDMEQETANSMIGSGPSVMFML